MQIVNDVRGVCVFFIVLQDRIESSRVNGSAQSGTRAAQLRLKIVLITEGRLELFPLDADKARALARAPCHAQTPFLYSKDVVCLAQLEAGAFSYT